MIINIDKPGFDVIFSNPNLKLPVRWEGNDFEQSVKELFNEYKESLKYHISKDDICEVNKVCNSLLTCIKKYHNGFPNNAYITFSKIMEKLFVDPFKIYSKSGFVEPFSESFVDPLNLYRVRNVSQNTIYKRSDIFHTPYSLRSKISTFRYSIAGYPCLYLSTSIKLCCEETPKRNINDFTIAAKFKLERDLLINGDLSIDVIELGVKPSDFNNDLENYNADETTNLHEPSVAKNSRIEHLSEINLNSSEIMGKYIYWYPLIAACSFIRINKIDPFASEYIIPQLLMQWVRSKSKERGIIGIRYFSCASNKASDMGFNYVFPVSGDKHPDKPNYCNYLRNIFKLTLPHFLNEYKSIQDCESALYNNYDLDYI